MTKKRNLTEKWTEFAEKRLLGKTIIADEYLTDKEIQDLWEIISNILDRNNIDDSGELSIKLI